MARTLIKSGAAAKGRADYLGLLGLASNVVDEAGFPYNDFAARALLKLGGAEEQILARVVRDLDDPEQLNADVTDQWRRFVEELRKSGDGAVREKAALLAERLRARKAYLEAAGALRDSFPGSA